MTDEIKAVSKLLDLAKNCDEKTSKIIIEGCKKIRQMDIKDAKSKNIA